MTSIHIGRNHIHLESVDSTNDYAMNLISKTNPIDGTVISASYQTKGKGQIGRAWSSDYGKNIMMSLILESSFIPLERQFDLSIATSIAVSRFIEKLTGVKPKVKWPNDIYLGDKKLGGILIQNVINGTSLKYSVIGIGINVFQVSFPSSIPNPIALTQVFTIEDSLDILYKKLFEHINQSIVELSNGNTYKQREEYLSLMYKRSEIASFEDRNGVKFKAVISGISNTGKLKLNVNGQAIYYTLNEAKMLI